MHLTCNQKDAVEASGHTLVSACPGSGKTSVLSLRAAHILNQSDSTKVVAVTFTKDSAESLRHRIENVSSKTRRRLITGTFHAIALKQIRNTPIFKNKRIIGGGEFYALVNRARQVAEDGEEISLDDAVEAIELFKSSISPTIRSDPAGQVYRIYQSILDRENMIDFADMLLLAVINMKNGQINPLPATHMLVDEAQDMDSVQYEWIKCHSDHGVIITLVGDDDQSIYGWRNAMGYDGLMRFKTDHRAEHITLADNFRSDQEIVAHADKLIQINTKRVQKDFICFSKDTGVVELTTHPDELDQGKVAARIASDGQEWGILARTNKILDVVELGLIAEKTPYTRAGGSSLWNREVIAVYLALLSSISSSSPNGVGTALHFAGVPDYMMGSLKSKSDITEALNAIFDQVKKDGSLPLVASFLQRFLLMLPQWQSLLKQKRVGLVCGGVSTWLSDFLKTPQVQVLDRASSILADLKGTLPERLNFVKGEGKKKKQSTPENAKVTLLTMHASKGLEFDCVAVLSCVEGIAPHLDSPLDEERRLFYVAMTRARHRLVLMKYMERLDGKIEADASRFLQEAGV